MILLWLLGCDDDPCPRSSMVESEGGLRVTEAEHPTGWGQADCAGCHALEQTHVTGCTPEVDLEEVREQVARRGLRSCDGCHGDNGVDE